MNVIRKGLKNNILLNFTSKLHQYSYTHEIKSLRRHLHSTHCYRLKFKVKDVLNII